MAKKDKEEAPVDTTFWMVTFSDLLMLLLTFFVMLLTMNSLDTGSIRAVFNVGGLGGGVGALLFPVQDREKGFMYSQGQQDAPLIVTFEMLEEMVSEGEVTDLNENLGNTEAPPIELYEIPEGFVISIHSDIFFASGQAEIQPQMFPALDRISQIINSVSNEVIVMGHTDSIQPDRSRFSTNWELSLYRALSVHRYFLEKGIAAERFSTGGCGPTRPISSEQNLDGRKKNRRVEIIFKRE